jgi:hypothetical protein
VIPRGASLVVHQSVQATRKPTQGLYRAAVHRFLAAFGFFFSTFRVLWSLAVQAFFPAPVVARRPLCVRNRLDLWIERSNKTGVLIR